MSLLAVLDQKTAKEVFNVLYNLKNKNRLIIYATHNRFFANMADCKLEMIDGNIKLSMPELNNQNFNHLKIHTQYSICEGAIKIDNLKDFCKEKKIPCLGLSDTSNLCGALEFAENISKVGTQPIIGTQIYFKFEDTTGLLPLIALNEKGYKKL